ncbi:MAG: ABC transporter permease [Gammaproteobacteria bacterium WSBS_2016_MAG_OTU1]
MNVFAPPVFSRRAWRLVTRNFLVWRKLMVSSIVTHLIEPIVFMLGFGLGIGGLVGEINGGSYLQFVAAGMTGYAVMNSASFEALYSAFTRMHVQRTWAAILHAPMLLDDVVTGEWLWAGIKSTFAGVAMLVVLSIIGLAAYPTSLLLLPVFLLSGLAFAGLALVVNALARGYELFSFYFTLFITPMLLLSGAFFPIETLPTPLRILSLFLPLRHVVDMARPLLNGELPPSMLLNITVLAIVAISGLWIANALTKRRFLS